MAEVPTLRFKVEFVNDFTYHLQRVTLRLVFKDVPIFQKLALEVCIHNRIATIFCYDCCETCNYDRHLCQLCGEGLRHNSTDWNTGLEHPCYTDAREEYEQQLRWELDRLGSSNA